MKVYRGINALSDFRRAQLLKKLRTIDPKVSSAEAEYCHFVDVGGSLSKQADQQLASLLSYDTPFSGQADGQLFLVTPRIGTISPWSSKATDIAHNTGLAAVKRIERGTAYYIKSPKALSFEAVGSLLHDRMTETVLGEIKQAERLFQYAKPKSMKVVDILKGGRAILRRANAEQGLALNDDEINYLYKSYKKLGRNPSDVELMMFAQVNSEHTRHKIFNAKWVVDGKEQDKSLFEMIKNTYNKSDKSILSAYSDNAAILKGPVEDRFFANPGDQVYEYHKEPVHLDIKAETHNHPTAIAPEPGAATGTGGEIRDEAAAGQGAKPKAGLAGYTVSNLNLPGAPRPWEKAHGKPDHMASALDIMIQAPLGASGYGNEYGRPTIAGYFRTYEQEINDQVWGYHKPIMIAGGIGNVREANVHKKAVPAGALVIQLGGPAMLIGLGGGAASSLQSGQSSQSLDFASVQRANAEMQRRAQEVIDYCWSLGEKNPILSTHDVGAGGLSNALPELVHNAGLGAKFELRDIPTAEPGMSPLEIWCNEAQERYVLAISPKDLKIFEAACQKERCPFAVVGEATKEARLILTDKHFGNTPIDLPLDTLFGNPPKMIRQFKRRQVKPPAFDIKLIDIAEAAGRVLHLPAVGSKKFLITIGDRTVSGLVARDPLVGPWQVPVSDVAVTSTTMESSSGEAMSLGERPSLALIDPKASVRMAIGEAITNITAAKIKKLSDVKLSANWMAAAGFSNQDQNLFDGVKTAGQEFCPALGVTIPVGKDSMSMRTFWQENGQDKSVVSPLSLVASAFAPVTNVQKTLTPELQDTESSLIYIDLGQGKNRLGGSALAQVYNQLGNEPPDIEPKILKEFFRVVQKLNQKDKIMAYHDRSDGGLFTTLCEMSFASRLGLEIQLQDLPGQSLDQLFNEELGAVIQVQAAQADKVLNELKKDLKYVYIIGKPQKAQRLVFKNGPEVIYQSSRGELEKYWADTSYQIQKLRDNPAGADEELSLIADDKDPGLSPSQPPKFITTVYKSRPKVAILREEGVNGHVEMAAAFAKAGFSALDVHLTQLINKQASLKDFVGLAAGGGFSYGDVLGAGEGWAKTILFNPDLRRQFSDFFKRPKTFSLGSCNGCQMLSALKEIIPGAELWPRFLKNRSEQFEARLVTVKLNRSPSIFFKDLHNSRLLVPVAHGEGRAVFPSAVQMRQALSQGLIAAQYVDNSGHVTERYPFNPGGSPKGTTALTTADGRATIIMPHPERAFLTKQLSWHPSDWAESSPWFRIFQNARAWVK